MNQYELAVEAITRVDQINANLSVRIQEIFATIPADEQMNTRVMRSVMSRIDREVKTVYGATEHNAVRSSMYKTIVESHKRANMAAVSNALTAIDIEMSRYAPEEWADLSRYLFRQEDAEYWEMQGRIEGDFSQRQRVMRSRMIDPQRRWVDPDGYRLSDRVFHQGRNVRNRLNDTIRRGVRRGESPLTIAKSLEQFVHPDYAPVRFTRDGRVLRRVDGRSYRPSATSATRRLARTEVANVYHEATRRFVADIDLVGAGVKWALSNAHPKIDICDEYARGSSRGYPRGVYRPDEFPHIPHPHCLCQAIPHMPSREAVLSQLRERASIA